MSDEMEEHEEGVRLRRLQFNDEYLKKRCINIGDQAKQIAMDNGIPENKADEIKLAIERREYALTKGMEWSIIDGHDKTARNLGWKPEWDNKLNKFPDIEGGSRKHKRSKTLRKKGRKLSKRKNKRKTLKNRR